MAPFPATVGRAEREHGNTRVLHGSDGDMANVTVSLEEVKHMRKWIGALMVSALLASAIPCFSQGAAAGQPFTDVPADHWAVNAVARLAKEGIIEGFPGGKYMGNQPMTRYQVAMALARLLDKVNEGANLDQIRNLIMTNPEIQNALRGAAGPAGQTGPAGAAGIQGPAGGPGQPVRKAGWSNWCARPTG